MIWYNKPKQNTQSPRTRMIWYDKPKQNTQSKIYTQLCYVSDTLCLLLYFLKLYCYINTLCFLGKSTQQTANSRTPVIGPNIFKRRQGILAICHCQDVCYLHAAVLMSTEEMYSLLSVYEFNLKVAVCQDGVSKDSEETMVMGKDLVYSEITALLCQNVTISCRPQHTHTDHFFHH